jgi:hypothetical protein
MDFESLFPDAYRLDGVPLEDGFGPLRVVGQAVTVVDDSAAQSDGKQKATHRRVLLFARSTDSSRPAVEQRTQILAIRRGARCRYLFTVMHRTFADELMKACGASYTSPKYNYTITVKNAAASADVELVAVTLECRIQAIKQTLPDTMPCTGLSSIVVLFHTTLNKHTIVACAGSTAHIPFLTTASNGDEDVLLLYEQEAVSDVNKIFDVARNTQAVVATRSRGGWRKEGTIRQFEILGTSAFKHKWLPGMLKPTFTTQSKRTASIDRMMDVKTGIPEPRLQWFQYDPWDATLFTLTRVGRNHFTYHVIEHNLDRNDLNGDEMAFDLQANLKSKYESATPIHHTAPDRAINARRWLTRAGQNVFVMQPATIRKFPGVALHFQGKHITPERLTQICFGKSDNDVCAFTLEFQQRCVTDPERCKCRVAYYSLNDRYQSYSVNVLVGLDIGKRVMDTLVVDGCLPYEIIVYDRHGDTKLRVIWPEGKPYPTPHARASTTSDHSYPNAASLGWEQHNRVVVLSESTDKRSQLEIMIPSRGGYERALFVRMYGMLAIILKGRPAILVDMEVRVPQYLFSCPVFFPASLESGNLPTSRSDYLDHSGRQSPFSPGSPPTSTADDRRGTMPPVPRSPNSPPREAPFDGTLPRSLPRAAGLPGGPRRRSSSNASSVALADAASPGHNPSRTTDMRSKFMVLPIAFHRYSEDTDTPSEPVAETVTSDASRPATTAGGIVRLPVYEPLISFGGVIEHVVLQHLRAFLQPDLAQEHSLIRGGLFYPYTRPLTQRTLREANLAVVYNALTIAASRLVYLRDGSLVDTATLGVCFDKLASVVFEAPCRALRSTALVLIVGCFAEAFQRVLDGQRTAEAYQARLRGTPVRDNSQSPPRKSKPAPGGSGQEPPHKSFSGFLSKFKLWVELFGAHWELAPVRTTFMVRDGGLDNNVGGTIFKFGPPHSAVKCDRPHRPAEAEQRQDRWHVECGDPGESAFVV